MCSCLFLLYLEKKIKCFYLIDRLKMLIEIIVQNVNGGSSSLLKERKIDLDY